MTRSFSPGRRHVRATIRREDKLKDEPWFVFIEDTYGNRSQAARFYRRASAETVAAAINRALEQEGRLLSDASLVCQDDDW